MTFKIRFLPYCSKGGPCFLNIEDFDKKYYTMDSYQQIIEYFLPDIKYEINSVDNVSDICITSINLHDKDLLRNNECNIMICIENIKNPSFKFYYDHYIKYNEYDNEKIRIYIYSHIDKLIKNEKYLVIPAIYCRINYYNLKYDYYKNNVNLNCSFNDKKFCLAINQSKINKNINIIKNLLSKIGKIDDIKMYNKYINNKSCYNSIELLHILNKYKFIICFENSYLDGYITEKIFNCFFAKTIPIYSGSKIITRFFNINSFINLENDNLNKSISYIKNINNNQNLYEKIINNNKINESYDDENYKEEFLNYLKK